MNPLQKQNTLAGLRKNMAVVRKKSQAPLKRLVRPRMGTRGASGPRGKWFQEKMIADLTRITFNTKHPCFKEATKLAKVLESARKGDLFPEHFAKESDTLNGILVKILKVNTALNRNQVKPLNLTSLERGTLENYYSLVMSSGH